MVLSPIAMFFGLFGQPVLSRIQPVMYALPALGALVIAPRKSILRIPVALSVILLLGWMVMSYGWSVDPPATLFGLRQQVSMMLALMVAVGLLPIEESFRWFLAGVKLLLVISIFAVLTDPDARTTLEQTRVEEAWQAWFPSKNQLGRFSVLAFATLLLLDKNKLSKLVYCALAIVLALGAASATAVAGLFMVAGVVFWIGRYRNVGEDWTGLFAVISVMLGVVALVAAFASVAIVVQALGRDLTFTGRTPLWDAIIPLIEAEPITGYGFEAIWTRESAISRELTRVIGFSSANAHNGALDTALSIGIPGLLLFFALLITTLTAALRHLRVSEFAAWTFVFVLLQLVFGSFESTYITDWLGLMVIGRLACAKLTNARRDALQEEQALVEALRPTLGIDLDADPYAAQPVATTSRP